MLTAETKRHIDAARQVLVGVVPNPAAQIDQITNALIYKFMDDMDQSAISVGDKPSFFVGELERYAWTRVMDSRLGNQERMNLYAEALIKFSASQKLPDLFRDIFRQAYLPFRSPDVLYLFLKEVDYFGYSHSEELGNAYEYLLSILSAQGDAGQFRTPRHIIDFIVEVVDPAPDDTILDPACGTAGFLISAYKHIWEKHTEIDQKTGKTKSTLTPIQRQKIMKNFEGYDISPEMVKLSRVNMYLHNFKNPRIYEYDTLSRDERWNDKFSVILANPPFMSPKGGIKPHSKFSVQSSRSEVLFVDYFVEHLKQPNGRAGIIVPEGIIFQSGSAHRELRKRLIDDGLYAVVSLPSGVFYPYTGVKTSVLFFDNNLVKRRKEILFIEVKNTGVGLNSTLNPVEENDLPLAVKLIQNFREGKEIKPTKVSFVVSKNEIIKPDYDLSANKYRQQISTNSKIPLVPLSEICTVTKGKSSSTKTEPGEYPLILMAAEFKTADHFDFQGEGVCVPLMTAASTGVAVMKRVHYVNGKFALANLLAFVKPKDENKVNSKYLYKVLMLSVNDLARLMKGAANVSMKPKDLETFKIPLPSMEVQKEIAGIFDAERILIDSVKNQLTDYDKKSQGLISELWGE
ncbi:MAG TPA: N-6 DNA methylase [Candidatus Paceibacterota bacterium]|nr:N-6 DNA methylase [Candidatus Paceibacterota bacterium]